MLRKNVHREDDLNQLMDELNAMSSDVSRYLAFLTRREVVRKRFLPEIAANNN